jgi:hypothetical protein
MVSAWDPLVLVPGLMDPSDLVKAPDTEDPMDFPVMDTVSASASGPA